MATEGFALKADEVRIDVFTNMSEQTYKMTHLPTGCVAVGHERNAVLLALTQQVLLNIAKSENPGIKVFDLTIPKLQFPHYEPLRAPLPGTEGYDPWREKQEELKRQREAKVQAALEPTLAEWQEVRDRFLATCDCTIKGCAAVRLVGKMLDEHKPIAGYYHVECGHCYDYDSEHELWPCEAFDTIKAETVT